MLIDLVGSIAFIVNWVLNRLMGILCELWKPRQSRDLRSRYGPPPIEIEQHIFIVHIYRIHAFTNLTILQHDSRAIMSVVGIDFGVKHCVIAAAGRGGVDVILNGNSQRLNP